MADKPDPLMNSVVAGRYEIFAKLGEGGMGAVYAAKQKPLGRTIALKVLLKSLSEDEIAVQRFEKEALAISRLAHPNTVTIFDYGKTEQGLMYIAMEFMEGRTLSDVMSQDGPLRPRRVVRIIAQIVRALSEAHQRGVIHRDLKPDNIMLVPTAGEPDFVKVLDFGVAKLRSQEGMDVKTLTKGDVIFGTPAYMSPQQVHGIMDDPRSDLYAVGVIAYEMLAGTPLFTGDSAITILMAQVQKIPPAFASLPKPVEVPAELEALVMKLLAKESDDRFSDCNALLHGLDKLPGLGGGLRPPSGDTMGMQRPVDMPVGPGKPSTRMMGSDFAEQKDFPAAQQLASGDDKAQNDLAPNSREIPTEAILQPLESSNVASDVSSNASGNASGNANIDATLIDDKSSALSASAVSPSALTDQGTAMPELDVLPKKKLGMGLLVVLLVVVMGLLAWYFGSKNPGAESKIATPVQAQLEVLSNPVGAQIFLDDKSVGNSPLKLSVQSGRAYTLRAELVSYESSTQQVEVKTNTSMQFTLVPLPEAPADADKKPDLAAKSETGPNKPKPKPKPKPKVQHKSNKPQDKPKVQDPIDDAPVLNPAQSKDPGKKPAEKMPANVPEAKPIANEGSPADFEKFDDLKAVD